MILDIIDWLKYEIVCGLFYAGFYLGYEKIFGIKPSFVVNIIFFIFALLIGSIILGWFEKKQTVNYQSYEK
ncbi:MAG: hypothetical protein AAB348_01035 [Patescibacteria group bacterium]